MRKNCIIEEKNGREIVKLDKFSEPDYFGFFTMFAAEMGDEETKNKLLQTADELFSPIWVDGTFHYPFNDNVAATFGPKKKKKVDNNDLQKQQPAPAVPMGSFGTGDCCKKSYQNSNLQDRMLALARALPPNGLWKMYNEPFDKQHFSEPAITDVDIKALKLKRAVYDRTKKALIVSTLGSDNNSEASFRMINLKPEGSYLLADNESVISKISGVKEYNIKLNNKISHDFILSEEYIEK